MNRVNYRYDSGHDDSTINIVMGIIIIINMGERETAHCMVRLTDTCLMTFFTTVTTEWLGC